MCDSYLLLRGLRRGHEVVLVVERQVDPEPLYVDLVPARRRRSAAAAGRVDVLAGARPGRQGLVTVHGVAARGHRGHHLIFIWKRGQGKGHLTVIHHHQLHASRSNLLQHTYLKWITAR